MLFTQKKTISIILVGLAMVVLTGCQKDKNDGTDANNIIGKWTITSSTVKATVNGVDMVQYLMTAFGISEAQAQVFADMYTQAVTGTVEIKSDGTYVTNISGEGVDSGTWQLSADNKKLTLDAGTADETIMDVVTLTSSQLELKFSQTDNTEDIDEDGTLDTLVMEMDLILTK